MNGTNFSCEFYRNSIRNRQLSLNNPAWVQWLDNFFQMHLTNISVCVCRRIKSKALNKQSSLPKSGKESCHSFESSLWVWIQASVELVTDIVSILRYSSREWKVNWKEPQLCVFEMWSILITKESSLLSLMRCSKWPRWIVMDRQWKTTKINWIIMSSSSVRLHWPSFFFFLRTDVVGLIENMHHIVTVISKQSVPALGAFVAQAREMYIGNLDSYIKIVLRRPLARLLVSTICLIIEVRNQLTECETTFL